MGSGVDVVTVVAACVGVLTGVAGVWFGVTGKREAKLSNKIAAEANTIAREAKGEAALSNKLSAEANTIAREANRFSEEANKQAAQANAVNETRLAVETERNDVSWVLDWSTPSELLVVNGGDDAAVRVKVTVRIDGREFTARAEEVVGGGHVSVDVSEAGSALIKEREDALESSRHSYLGAGVFIEPQAWVWVRVVWETPLGKPLDDEINAGAFTAANFGYSG